MLHAQLRLGLNLTVLFHRQRTKTFKTFVLIWILYKRFCGAATCLIMVALVKLHYNSCIIMVITQTLPCFFVCICDSMLLSWEFVVRSSRYNDFFLRSTMKINPLHIPIKSKRWFPQFSLSFPAGSGPHSRISSTPGYSFYAHHWSSTKHEGPGN